MTDDDDGWPHPFLYVIEANCRDAPLGNLRYLQQMYMEARAEGSFELAHGPPMERFHINIAIGIISLEIYRREREGNQ